MILHGDSLERLKEFPDNYFDSVVTDPPYGLSFMNKHWDYDVPTVELWREVLRVLKPGGHLLSFGGTRTYHRMVVAIEDAGFEIRDQLQWLQGAGFPKSLNVNKSCAKDNLTCGCKEIPEHDMRPLRHSDLPETLNAIDQHQQILQSSVQEHSLPSAVLRSQSEKRSSVGAQSGLEGRSYLQADEGQLHRPEVRESAKGISSDGSQRRLHNGTSFSDGETNRKALESNRSGASHGSQHTQQPFEQSRVVADERQSQSGGAWPRCNRCSKPILPEGLGTALKPANEPIVLARKPLSEKTVAKNVLRWGTGALNIDASRIASSAEDFEKRKAWTDKYANGQQYEKLGVFNKSTEGLKAQASQGRWPANLLLDEQSAAMLDEQSGVSFAKKNKNNDGRKTDKNNVYQTGLGVHSPENSYNDSGGASRFFYVAKASKAERNRGLEGMPEREGDAVILNGICINCRKVWIDGRRKGPCCENPERTSEAKAKQSNHHPTVKPIKLMEYLCRLITPPAGIILDPFCGSGSTGVAAKNLGFGFVGVEREEEYVRICEKRLENAGA